MRIKAIVAAAAVATSAALASPAQAQEAVTCGMATTSDPTGLVTMDPNVQTGVVLAGPLTEVREDGHVAQAQIICSIQVNDANHSGADAFTAASPETPVAVLPPYPVSFVATSFDSVYLCTEYVIDGEHVFYDADPDTPGDQCVLATSADLPGGATTYVVPCSMDWCIWEDDDPIICIP